MFRVAREVSFDYMLGRLLRFIMRLDQVWSRNHAIAFQFFHPAPIQDSRFGRGTQSGCHSLFGLCFGQKR
jgi:hypothetical protein